MVRVFLVDDHEVVRAGLRVVLDTAPGVEVVGEAGSVAQALEGITRTRPDVAVVDGRLPDGTGIEVCRRARSLSPRTRSIVLTSYDEDFSLLAAVRAGAVGFLLKEIGTNDLVGSVRAVHEGGDVFDRDAVDAAQARAADPLAADPRLSALTPAERRVLRLVGTGRTNRQIGDELHLAEKTVKNYVSTVLGKLGLSSRTQAALFLTRPGT